MAWREVTSQWARGDGAGWCLLGADEGGLSRRGGGGRGPRLGPAQRPAPACSTKPTPCRAALRPVSPLHRRAEWIRRVVFSGVTTAVVCVCECSVSAYRGLE